LADASMSEFTTVLAVVLLAVLSPIIAGRIKIPGVVTEVMLGMLLGLVIFLVQRFEGITLLATEGQALDFLAEVGFIMLLFLVGLEVDFDRIEAQGPRPFIIGAIFYAMTFGLAYTAVWYFQLPFIMTLVLATTAVDVVLPTMREVGLHRTQLGHTVTLSATIADFTTISVLTVYVFAQDFGGGGPFHPAYLLIPALLLIFWIAYKLGGELVWRFPHALSRFFKAEDPTELGVRASLALMFVFVGLSSAFGVETIFGAFFAGVMISALFREGALLEEKLYGVGYGFFVPIFFLSVGLSFDFGALADLSALVVLPTLLLIAFAVKIIPSVLFLPKWGLRKSFSIGMLMSARLSFMIAVASVALQLGLVTADLYAATILLAIILSITGPSVFRMLMRGTHGATVRDRDLPPSERKEGAAA
jgi:Kef-type K+ transport system membrane component KefB